MHLRLFFICCFFVFEETLQQSTTISALDWQSPLTKVSLVASTTQQVKLGNSGLTAIRRVSRLAVATNSSEVQAQAVFLAKSGTQLRFIPSKGAGNPAKRTLFGNMNG